MERYLTDAVYARRVGGRPPELEREEKHLYAELSARIPGEEYLRIEEELNHFHEELGKELFGRGFMEGMRFFLQCLSPCPAIQRAISVMPLVVFLFAIC